MASTTSDQVQVGHWTATDLSTGCTVMVFPEGCTASGEVRGGAPATREFELLDPRRMVQHVDAVVLTGGSAFGLSVADGVVAAMVEADRGFETRAGRVPIVVAMGLFDLTEDGQRPGPEQGQAAVAAASASEQRTGRVGAGAGATVGKWRGLDHKSPGGLGHVTVTSGDLSVTAVIAVNAIGDIDDGTTAAQVLAGDFVPPVIEETSENTTIGVIWTNAALDKIQCRVVAESGHDGFGRALMPAHTSGDGDALVAVSVGQIEAPLAAVRMMATIAVEQAIRSCRG